jgi:hypothetical protein
LGSFEGFLWLKRGIDFGIDFEEFLCVIMEFFAIKKIDFRRDLRNSCCLKKDEFWRVFNVFFVWS